MTSYRNVSPHEMASGNASVHRFVEFDGSPILLRDSDQVRYVRVYGRQKGVVAFIVHLAPVVPAAGVNPAEPRTLCGRPIVSECSYSAVSQVCKKCGALLLYSRRLREPVEEPEALPVTSEAASGPGSLEGLQGSEEWEFLCSESTRLGVPVVVYIRAMLRAVYPEGYGVMTE